YVWPPVGGTREPAGAAGGPYRILPPHRSDVAPPAGASALASRAPLAGGLVEAGRSCVDPAHRNGSVITLMWSAPARYTLLSGHRYLGGCASVPQIGRASCRARGVARAGAGRSTPDGTGETHVREVWTT